ncbi:protein ECERIFERUM 26 [Mangifera indica]|uniref:protein ECERIFERUM 26 n=1 Tax=Mangifera indica TaxID=29780 RepID=UPI001CFBA7A8|nr:protein ECERIFERUM 26 [Mangifera indica]
MSSEVTYICKRTVASTKPVQPGKFYHFSVLDRLMEKNHLRIVYYYSSKGARKAGELTKKLRESMAEVLTCFPVVTGRLQKNSEGQWMIKCNDAGVRMVEARARGSVDDWLRNVNREKERKLVYWEDMHHKPYFWSTFYVQITEFEEGGLAIGLSCFHLLADPICATMFIKAWADITSAQIMLTPPYVHPLPPRRIGNMNPNHKHHTALINHYKSSIERSIPFTTTKHVTVTLSFTDPMVRACIAMARPPGAADPSPFAALAGLFWVCVSRVKGTTEGLVNMSICLDMRKELGLDKGFFGNCLVYNKVQADSFDENKLSGAAEAIGEVVRKMDNEGIMDLIEWLGQNDSRISPPLMNGCELICANLEGLDSCSAAFEEGLTPSRISCYVEPALGEGQILVLPSSTSEGPLSRMIMATLTEDEAVRLCEDDVILSFSPTILMGA